MLFSASVVNRVNQKRKIHNLRIFWNDYEVLSMLQNGVSINNLYAYVHCSNLMRISCQNNNLENQQILLQNYTHLACYSNQKQKQIQLLLSYRSIAIDSIFRKNNQLLISVIQLNQYNYLWGVVVKCIGQRPQQVTPKFIIKRNHFKYIEISLHQNTAIQEIILYGSKVQPLYGRNLYEIGQSLPDKIYTIYEMRIQYYKSHLQFTMNPEILQIQVNNCNLNLPLLFKSHQNRRNYSSIQNNSEFNFIKTTKNSKGTKNYLNQSDKRLLYTRQTVSKNKQLQFILLKNDYDCYLWVWKDELKINTDKLEHQIFSLKQKCFQNYIKMVQSYQTTTTSDQFKKIRIISNVDDSQTTFSLQILNKFTSNRYQEYHHQITLNSSSNCINYLLKFMEDQFMQLNYFIGNVSSTQFSYQLLMLTLQLQIHILPEIILLNLIQEPSLWAQLLILIQKQVFFLSIKPLILKYLNNIFILKCKAIIKSQNIQNIIKQQYLHHILQSCIINALKYNNQLFLLMDLLQLYIIIDKCINIIDLLNKSTIKYHGIEQPSNISLKKTHNKLQQILSIPYNQEIKLVHDINLPNVFIPIPIKEEKGMNIELTHYQLGMTIPSFENGKYNTCLIGSCFWVLQHCYRLIIQLGNQVNLYIQYIPINSNKTKKSLKLYNSTLITMNLSLNNQSVQIKWFNSFCTDISCIYGIGTNLSYNNAEQNSMYVSIKIEQDSLHECCLHYLNCSKHRYIQQQHKLCFQAYNHESWIVLQNKISNNQNVLSYQCCLHQECQLCLWLTKQMQIQKKQQLQLCSFYNINQFNLFWLFRSDQLVIGFEQILLMFICKYYELHRQCTDILLFSIRYNYVSPQILSFIMQSSCNLKKNTKFIQVITAHIKNTIFLLNYHSNQLLFRPRIKHQIFYNNQLSPQWLKLLQMTQIKQILSLE